MTKQSKKGGNSPRKVIEYAGISFDSAIELEYFKAQIQLHPDLAKCKTFDIIPSFEVFKDGKQSKVRALTYTPDFVRSQGTSIIYIEVKSPFTAKKTDYILRKKLFLRNLKSNEYFIEAVKEKGTWTEIVYQGMKEVW